MIYDFWPPELWNNKFLFFKPPSLGCFVTAIIGNKNTHIKHWQVVLLSAALIQPRGLDRVSGEQVPFDLDSSPGNGESAWYWKGLLFIFSLKNSNWIWTFWGVNIWKLPSGKHGEKSLMLNNPHWKVKEWLHFLASASRGHGRDCWMN